MQSKTSCFNKTLFRKHVTRFWPIWAAYFGVWLLILPLGLLGARTQIALDPMYVRQWPRPRWARCICPRC